MSDNPYSAPFDSKDEQAEQKNAIDASMQQPSDAAENVRFTSRIVRGLAVVSAIASIYSLIALVMGFYYLGGWRGWGWIHSLTAVRGMDAPVLGLLTLFLWKYSTSLKRVANASIQIEHQQHIERMTWVWIGLAFLAFSKICEFAVRFFIIQFVR